MAHSEVWVVAGAPGAGKSTVADKLLGLLQPVPALIDKDTLYGPFVTATLAAAGRPTGEREGDWYDQNIKVHEYTGMTAVAREIRARGCPVMLSAPFTEQIRDPRRWNSWVDELGGVPVHLVWIRSDRATLKRRLQERNSSRDTAKLADFDRFIARIRPDAPPPIAHLAIDNRLAAAVDIDTQLRTAVDRQIAADPIRRAQRASELIAQCVQRGTELAEVRRAAIEEAHDNGMSYTEIANILAVSKGRITQIRSAAKR